MDCEKCQKLLGDLLEGSLDARERQQVAAHLSACRRCAVAREETEAIVSAARECREHLYSPPDSRALWLRISNTIEGERAFARPAAAAPALRPARTRGGLAGLWQRRWELTLPQMVSAVAALVVGVSLVTAMATQRMMSAEQNEAAAAGARPAKVRRDALGDMTYPATYVRQQQASINYYQQRVEQRKASWNPRMRDSFDRSLSVIDQAVADSLRELENNPHDEVSEEILNAALRDKVELLREFGEQ